MGSVDSERTGPDAGLLPAKVSDLPVRKHRMRRMGCTPISEIGNVYPRACLHEEGKRSPASERLVIGMGSQDEDGA
jgi:hypothetical protein